MLTTLGKGNLVASTFGRMQIESIADYLPWADKYRDVLDPVQHGFHSYRGQWYNGTLYIGRVNMAYLFVFDRRVWKNIRLPDDNTWIEDIDKAYPFRLNKQVLAVLYPANNRAYSSLAIKGFIRRLNETMACQAENPEQIDELIGMQPAQLMTTLQALGCLAHPKTWSVSVEKLAHQLCTDPNAKKLLMKVMERNGYAVSL